jgi:hypothetical protein
MKKQVMIPAILLVALTVSGRAFSQSHSGVEDLSRPAGDAPPMLGIHWARGFNPSYLQQHAQAGTLAASSADMTYHGGKILTTAVTQNIFWGTSWGNKAGDKITGLDSWYVGFENSPYAETSDEYTGSNGQVGPATTYLGHVIDTSRAASGNNTSNILAEVCRRATLDPNGNGYYSVYVDLSRKGNYCAYHSWGSCNGTPVQFAFFWKLDGDPGCDPQSTVPNESQGLAALANVSGHEVSEARTDPTGAGWFDSGGAENGDKCVWTFNVPYVTFGNGTEWKIQGEWSNAADDGGFGYPNSSGQVGCLDGNTANEYLNGSP